MRSPDRVTFRLERRPFSRSFLKKETWKHGRRFLDFERFVSGRDTRVQFPSRRREVGWLRLNPLLRDTNVLLGRLWFVKHLYLETRNVAISFSLRLTGLIVGTIYLDLYNDEYKKFNNFSEI